MKLLLGFCFILASTQGKRSKGKVFYCSEDLFTYFIFIPQLFNTDNSRNQFQMIK